MAGTKTPNPRGCPMRDDSDSECPTPDYTALCYHTEYRGNRILRHFYPEHWAKVQIARWTQQRYGVPNGA